MKVAIFFYLILFSMSANAQNFFKVKLDNCNAGRFCADCGDVKAGYEEDAFKKLVQKLNKLLDLKDIEGAIKFQVLIDSSGKACVQSHTDQDNNSYTLKIINELNEFRGWTPAISKGNIVGKASIILVFTIYDKITEAKVERFDPKNIFKSANKL